MIDKLIFLNEAWSWPILLGAAVLFIVFIWKESSQFPSFRFYIKVVVAFIAILSLCMIALKPAILNPKSSGDHIILTEAYKEASLDSLERSHKNIKVLDYTAGNLISEELVGIDSVFILGHGLKSYDLWQLEEKSTKYYAGASLKGITKFKYDSEQTIGDNAIFQGLYSHPSQGNKLLLEGAGGQILDSVILIKNTKQQFKLSADLKSAGNFVFRITEKDSLGNLITSNPIPLKVSEKEELQVLILNGFPTFETKYLKNFLAEMDHKVVVRSRLTTGRFKYESFNTEKTAVGAISEKLLENFDLLIIGLSSLNALSTSVKKSVEKSVRETGLGVFIQPDQNLFRVNSGLAAFNFTQDNLKETKINGNFQVTKYPYSFTDGLRLEPIQNSGNKVLSAYKRIGLGKIGSTTLENTFELLLAGHTNAYRQLWTKLINVLSKKTSTLAEWSSDHEITEPDEPFHFQVRTLEKTPVVLNTEGSVIPLRQDLNIPELWTGITYPKRSGWQQLHLQHDSTLVYNFYVYNPGDWDALSTYKMQQENLRIRNSVETIARKNTHRDPINLVYFYLAFLFSIGYLWLEPKMRDY